MGLKKKVECPKCHQYFFRLYPLTDALYQKNKQYFCPECIQLQHQEKKRIQREKYNMKRRKKKADLPFWILGGRR